MRQFLYLVDVEPQIFGGAQLCTNRPEGLHPTAAPVSAQYNKHQSLCFHHANALSWDELPFSLPNMTDSIADALARLQVHEESAADDPIDDILSKQAPPHHRQHARDPDQLKAHLEEKYLSPSQNFSTEWLNKLQQ